MKNRKRESDWLTAKDPTLMLEVLNHFQHISDRKYILFSVACFRRIWPLLTDPRYRRAVEAAERYADGQANRREVQAAADAAFWHRRSFASELDDLIAWKVANIAVRDKHPLSQSIDDKESENEVAAYTSSQIVNMVKLATELPGNEASKEVRPEVASHERAFQAELLHDIVGNPFRPAPHIPQSWISWNDGCVLKLAARIYEERLFENLPMLADALEDAGCRDESILVHLRGHELHTRGCWVLDLLLRKEEHRLGSTQAETKRFRSPGRKKG